MTTLVAVALTTTGIQPASAATISVEIKGTVTDGIAPPWTATLYAHERVGDSWQLGTYVVGRRGVFPPIQLDPDRDWAFTIDADGFIEVSVAGTDWETGRTIRVTSGSIDIGTVVLAPDPSITGKVINADGTPAADQLVELYDADDESSIPGGPWLRDVTNADGSYEFPYAHPKGIYRIAVQGDATHATSYYGGGANIGQAKPFKVKPGVNVLPTVTRTRAAALTARFLHKGKSAGARWTLQADTYNPITKEWQLASRATSQKDGTVRVGGLQLGSAFRLTITPPILSDDTIPEWPLTLYGGVPQNLKTTITDLGPLHLDKLNPPIKRPIPKPRLSKSKQTYGHKKTAKLTIIWPEGKNRIVDVFDGKTYLGSTVLTNGRGTFRLPTGLSTGPHKITVQTKVAASEPVTYTVTKAKLAKTPTVSGLRNARSKRLKVTVRLGRLDNGAYPSGRVRIYVGSQRVRTVKVGEWRKGTITESFQGPYRKSVKVRAKYLGDANTRPASTKTRTAKTR